MLLAVTQHPADHAPSQRSATSGATAGHSARFTVSPACTAAVHRSRPTLPQDSLPLSQVLFSSLSPLLRLPLLLPLSPCGGPKGTLPLFQAARLRYRRRCCTPPLLVTHDLLRARALWIQPAVAHPPSMVTDLLAYSSQDVGCP